MNHLKQSLCAELANFIRCISQGDNDRASPKAFLLMGKPDAKSFFCFADQWKLQKKNIHIVLSGGRGRGTIPLILNIFKHIQENNSAVKSKDQQMIQKWMEDTNVLEVDLI